MGDISGKVDIAHIVIYRQSDWGDIRKMSGCDGNVEKHGDGTIDEIVALVWNGPGLYEIESLVLGVYSIDTMCFDMDGLKCELESMFPDGMGWHDANIRKC